MSVGLEVAETFVGTENKRFFVPCLNGPDLAVLTKKMNDFSIISNHPRQDSKSPPPLVPKWQRL